MAKKRLNPQSQNRAGSRDNEAGSRTWLDALAPSFQPASIAASRFVVRGDRDRKAFDCSAAGMLARCLQVRGPRFAYFRLESVGRQGTRRPRVLQPSPKHG